MANSNEQPRGRALFPGSAKHRAAQAAAEAAAKDAEKKQATPAKKDGD